MDSKLGYNNVLISTVPRTGSMWIYNITKNLLLLSGNKVKPENESYQLTHDCEINKLLSKLQTDNLKNEYISLLKIHYLVTPSRYNSKIITSIRDPREICFSFLKFMNTTFEHAFEISKNIVKYIQHYSNFNDILYINFDDIKNNSESVIKKIINYLDLNVSKIDIANLNDKFKKKNIKKYINTVVNKSEIVICNRHFDKTTGFQSNHINNSNSTWNTYFNEKQKKILNDYFKNFLLKHNLH